MYNKRSRYYRLKEVTFTDHTGVERACKALRRDQTVNGRLNHTLEASDRLDHLAYKYYQQSLHWWRICDANPDFASPLEFLNKSATNVILLNLSTQQSPPPLTDLYRLLSQTSGVEQVQRHGNSGLPEREVVDTAPIFSLPDALVSELEVAERTQQLSPALLLALQAEAVALSTDLRISHPDTGLWQIEDHASATVFRFSHDSDSAQINVNQAAVTYYLALQVRYNSRAVNQEQITALVSAAGFAVEELTEQTRVGQYVVIPPRFTGLN